MARRVGVATALTAAVMSHHRLADFVPISIRIVGVVLCHIVLIVISLIRSMGVLLISSLIVICITRSSNTGCGAAECSRTIARLSRRGPGTVV